MADGKLLRINAVKEKTGLKQAMLYALIAKGEFAPIKLTKRCSAWLLSEVEAFICVIRRSRTLNPRQAGQ